MSSFGTLQQAISMVPSNEQYVILGDFNARVGSRGSNDVRGPHGTGESNEAGRELLTFLSIDEATECNTWFQLTSRPGSTPRQGNGTAFIMP